MLNFNDIFVDDTKYGMKIPKEKYLSVGLYPVIDQSKEQIAGYTDESEGIYCDVPAIIFGDHTRIIKYIDVPFFLGADGTKLLKIKDNTAFNCKYLYYALSNAKIPNTGYNRHFKWLKELSFNIPSIEKQREIADLMDIIVNLENLRKKQLEKLELFVKSRFVELFGNPKDNPKRFKSIRIGELTDVLTGSTPNRSNKDYYEGKIPWVKTGEIHPGYINSTEECISEVALKETTCKLLPVDTVMIAMYGQGKTRGQSGILGIKAATNQACAAILPCKKLNPVFLNQYLVIEYSRLRDMGRGAQQANLNLSMIKNYHILSIPIELQNQFADFVAQVDKSKYIILILRHLFNAFRKIL